MNKTIKEQNVDTAENVILALIKGVGFQSFAVGINNAMCHGKALEQADISFTDKQLEEIFEHIEAFVEISKTLD